MTEHQPRAEIRAIAAIVEAPVATNRAARTFDLPPILHGLMIGAFLAFLGILGAAFMDAELVIPFAIFIIYIGMFFGVPALWTQVVPRPIGRYQSWSEFMCEGLAIHTGEISGKEAVVQVLMLPALIVSFALAIAAIAAMV